MEYLIPLIAALVIGVLTLAAGSWLGRRARRSRPVAPRSQQSAEVSEARAREAAGLLDEAGHRTVYGHIAQSRVMEAIRAYRTATGRSLRDAVLDVQSLAAHPQVHMPAAPEPFDDGGDAPDDASPVSGGTDADPAAARPADASTADANVADPRAAEGARAAQSGMDAKPGTEAEPTPDAQGETDPARPQGPASSGAPGRPADPADPVRSTGPADPAADLPAGSEPLVVPADWTAQPAPDDAPFSVEVLRADGSVHVSSRDLPPWLRDQMDAMVRDGNLESAAVQLSSHTELTVPEAFELLRRLRQERHGGGTAL